MSKPDARDAEITPTPKRKPGRPTKLTASVKERLLKLIRSGKTVAQSCRALKISKDAVDDLRERDAAFLRDSARATVMGAEANLELCEERLKRSTNKRISVDRELAHHFRWKASKLLSAYRDRLGIDADVRLHEEQVDDYTLARRFFFAISNEAVAAPIPKFIQEQLSLLELIASSVATRGGGSLDKEFHQGDFADVLGAIRTAQGLLAMRLEADMPKLALPAPAVVGQGEKQRSPMDNFNSATSTEPSTEPPRFPVTVDGEWEEVK